METLGKIWLHKAFPPIIRQYLSLRGDNFVHRVIWVLKDHWYVDIWTHVGASINLAKMEIERHRWAVSPTDQQTDSRSVHTDLLVSDRVPTALTQRGTRSAADDPVGRSVQVFGVSALVLVLHVLSLSCICVYSSSHS